MNTTLLPFWTLSILLVGCTTTIDQQRAPATREPTVNESLYEIRAELESTFGIPASEISSNISILHQYRYGQGRTTTNWVGGNYFPHGLGGLSAKPGVFSKFMKKIEPDLEAVRKENNLKAVPKWSSFCQKKPTLCASAMEQVCNESKRTSAVSSMDKIRLGLQADKVHFSEKLFPSQVLCSPIDRKFTWWEGYCDSTFSVQNLFPNPPLKKVLNGVHYTKEDIEVAAYLLVREANAKSRGVGFGQRVVKEILDETNPEGDNWVKRHEAIDDLNPASLLFLLVNTYGKYPEKFAFVADKDASPEVWNYQIISYQIKNEVDLSNEQAKAIYEHQKKLRPLFNASNKAKYFKKIDLVIKYASGPVTYGAILEVDENQNMVGGEWLQIAHPDFIWWDNSTLDDLLHTIDSRPDLRFLYKLISSG